MTHSIPEDQSVNEAPATARRPAAHVDEAATSGPTANGHPGPEASRPIVVQAGHAINSYARDNLTRSDAALLLPYWYWYSDLTEGQQEVVLAMFPADLFTDPKPGAPQFNPGALVHLIMQLLGDRYGIPTEIDSRAMGPAFNAAADMLRALGVAPSSAPSRVGRNQRQTGRAR